MSYRLSEKERSLVCRLDKQARYAHFLMRVVDSREVWGLYSQEGWASAESVVGIQAFVIWPHSEYAQAKVVGECDWEDTAPEPIALDVFIDDWLPRLQLQAVPIAVFPVNDCKGIVVSSQKLAADLRSALLESDHSRG